MNGAVKTGNKDENVSFAYVYSAEEQDEIRRIRQKYQLQEEDNMSRIRKLDASVTKKATINSLVIGIIGSLVMGTGMSLIMTDLGNILGMQGTVSIVIGVASGLVGILLIGAAYPVYNKVLKVEREKIASEILKLTEEFLK